MIGLRVAYSPNMGGNDGSRKALEDFWFRQVQAARQKFEVARNNFDAVRQQMGNSRSTNADHDVLYRRAMRDEQHAMEEYARVLRVYADLILGDNAPGEHPHKGK